MVFFESAGSQDSKEFACLHHSRFFFVPFSSSSVDHGSWFDFTESWWSQRDRENVKICFYEDLQEVRGTCWSFTPQISSSDLVGSLCLTRLDETGAHFSKLKNKYL